MQNIIIYYYAVTAMTNNNYRRLVIYDIFKVNFVLDDTKSREKRSNR